MERIFGFLAHEALGTSLDLIIPANLRDRHWAGYHETMRTGATKYGAGELLSVPAIHKTGQRISVQFSITPSMKTQGVMTGMAAIMRDVTSAFEERKSLVKALAAR